MTVAFISLLFMSAVWVGELFFVQDALGRGDVAYGLLLSIWTVGMALGALLLSPRVAAGAVAASGLAAVPPRGRPGAARAVAQLWLLPACSFMGGLAHGLKNVMFRSLLHVRVPDRLHGRAFAAYNGIRNSAELGAFAAGGVLVALIGPRGTLAYAGGLSRSPVWSACLPCCGCTAAGCRPDRSGRRPVPPAGVREEDERVVDGRDAQVVDPPDDDPVVAGGMLGDDLALEAWRGRR